MHTITASHIRTTSNANILADYLYFMETRSKYSNRAVTVTQQLGNAICSNKTVSFQGIILESIILSIRNSLKF